MKTSIRRLVLALVLAVVSFAGLASGAQAKGIVFPVPDSGMNFQPVDFRGNASLNIIEMLSYSLDVNMYLYYTEQMKWNDEYGGYLHNRYYDQIMVGSGEDTIDIDGDWNIHMADVTDRRQYNLIPTQYENHFTVETVPLPNGAPLQDGKYDMRIVQHNISFGSIGTHPFDPPNNNWIAAFWIDTGIPDTILDSEEPSGSSGASSRTFTFHAEDVNPLTSSGTFLICRMDDEEWEDAHQCNHPRSELHTPTRVGYYEATDLSEGRHTFGVRTSDWAGNVDPTPVSSTFYVDGTDPEIDIALPGGAERFVLGADIDSDFTCTDPLVGTPPGNSGIKSCEGPAKIDTSTLGEHTFTVQAEDNAGNTSEKSTTYFVDPPKYADVIKSAEPIAYYRLGDPGGSATMIDSSGRGHHGEYKNGIELGQPPAPACQVRPNPPAVCELSDEPEDSSAAFPERGGYGYANGISAPQTAYSIEAWIKRNGTGDESIAGQGGGGQLFVKGDRLALRQTQDTVISSGPVLEPGRWWHVAATWDGDLTRLFVNGEEVASSDSANKAPSGGGTFYVGYGDQAPWFHGDLDEVAYYGRALSEEEIFTRYLVGTVTDSQDGPAVAPLSLPDTTEPVAGPDTTEPVDEPDTTEPVDGPDTTEPVDETPGSTSENESGPTGYEGPAGPAATGPSGKKIAKKKAVRKRAALKKCKRIKKAPKRRKCIRRVQARF